MAIGAYIAYRFWIIKALKKQREEERNRVKKQLLEGLHDPNRAIQELEMLQTKLRQMEGGWVLSIPSDDIFIPFIYLDEVISLLQSLVSSEQHRSQ